MSNRRTDASEASGPGLVEAAISALNDVLHIDVTIAETRPVFGDRIALTLQVGEQKICYLANVRPDKLNSTSIRNAIEETVAKDSEQPGLLVTPQLSRGLAEICIEHRLQFVDLAGNAHLFTDGFYVQIVGRRPLASSPLSWDAKHTRTKATSSAALRIMFAVMRHADVLNQPYRDIANAAGVSVGSVAGTFDSWRAQHIISEEDPKYGRRLLAAPVLLDEWVMGYPQRIYPKLQSQRFSLATPDWWTHYDVKDWAKWSGEVAVNKVFGELRPETQTLYVRPNARQSLLKDLAAHHRLRADPNGSLEVIDAFWDFDDIGSVDDIRRNIAPAPLVYADLIRTREPRNREAARSLRNAMETTHGFDWT